jgi:hypothetical protein
VPAKPAAARVVHSSQLYGPDFAVDAGSVFVQTGNAIRGVNLRTGARTTPYRVPDGYRQYAMDARGGRLAVGIDAAVEPGGPLPRVDSVPEAGGPATVVADSTATDDCYRTVRLAGVTESGETVTDEMDCNAPLVDYPGTLFAYAPDGDRRVFGTRKVPDPYVLYDESEIRLRGERYVLLVPDPRGPGQGRVFVAGRAGARRLV